MTVTAVTVSLRISDTEYGRGSERFLSLKGEVTEGEGIPLEDYDQVLSRVMDLQLQAWEAVQASRYSGGEITGKQLQPLIEQGRKRTERIKAFLSRGNDVDTDSDTTKG